MKKIAAIIAASLSLTLALANDSINRRVFIYESRDDAELSSQTEINLEEPMRDNYRNGLPAIGLSDDINRQSFINRDFTSPDIKGAVFESISNEETNKVGFRENFTRLQRNRQKEQQKYTGVKPVIKIIIVSQDDQTQEYVEPSEEPDVVYEYRLRSNYPNPFNPSTTINFSLPQEDNVNLSIYNIRGQLVKTLINDNLERGEHSVEWSGLDTNNRHVGSGVYFYRLDSSHGTKIKRMILLK